MAPSYAIIAMAQFEELFLKSCHLKPLVWWRYIDDIFLVWEHGEDSLKQFLKKLNSVHHTLKFTADYSTEKINFLDVTVNRVGDTLKTDLYIKPTDTHQFLDASSCHPVHCKTSIPYSQALRLNRICSETSEFDKRCNELEEWLIKRGYNERLVRQKVLDARAFSRKDLLFRERFEKKEKITFNLIFHPAFQYIHKILRRMHVILKCDKTHKEVFHDAPIVGFRKGKSLKDMLVRAKVPPLVINKGQSIGCLGNRCSVCPFVKSTTGFADKTGKQYNIRSATDLNCNSKNVVYLLKCKTCCSQYVGSCTTKFRLRFNNYKSCNNNHLQKTVPQQGLHDHFDLPDHNGIQDWEFTLIDQGDSELSVRKRERFWQYKLNTFLPNGLNDCEVLVPT